MKYFRNIPYKQFLSVALLLSFPFSVLGIEPEKAGNILDTFKEQEKEILFETLPADKETTENVFEKELRINGIQSLIQKVKTLKDTYEEKKELLWEERVTLEETIASLDQSIQDSTDSIAATEISMQKKRWDIQLHRSESMEIKKTIRNNKITILKYLNYIYSKGDMMYDDQNTIDSIKMMILNDGNMDEILSDILYKGLITQIWQQYIEEYKKSVRNLYNLNMVLSDEIIVLEKLEAQLSREKTALEWQKKQREKLLEITKGREELFTEYIASQKRVQATLETAWMKAQEDYESAIKLAKEKNWCTDAIMQPTEQCEKIELFFQREKEIRSMSLSGTNIFDWPVESPRITTYFHDSYYYNRFWSHHDAIDIGVPQGSIVRAAQDGYISYILPPDSEWYAYLAIRHPEWFVTVYGHMSEISVEIFQYVRKGDIIGKSGWLPWTDGAWPMTTGAHLHFEVFQDEEPVDPLRFLTLKDLNPETLATRYRTKFIEDTITESQGENVENKLKDTFVIRGETEEERQKYFITTYAAPSFRNRSLWIDEALGAGIDPSFFMCVGLAETSLGYNLKTAYNVWNIGNTDSGSTYTFASPKEWLYWMARTFNNKFLGDYTKVSELSRWGNTTGSIYASSNENWHNNIIRCLSSLKWRFVEDDFLFRLEK
jgi:septal ring factor EnvC (AmiA/AmiB activator)